MKQHTAVLFILILASAPLLSLSEDDMRFIHNHELYDALPDLLPIAREIWQNDPDNRVAFDLIKGYYRHYQDYASLVRHWFEDASLCETLSSAVQGYELMNARDVKPIWADSIQDRLYFAIFTEPHQQEVLDFYRNPPSDEQNQTRIDSLIARHGEANEILESWVRRKVDEIAVERDAQTMEEKIDALLQLCPDTQWKPELNHWKLYTMRKREEWERAYETILSLVKNVSDIRSRWFLAQDLMNDEFLDAFSRQRYPMLLQAQKLLNEVERDLPDVPPDGIRIRYRNLERDVFARQLALQQAINYTCLSEESDNKENDLNKALTFIDTIAFDNNDYGDQTSLTYWKGKILMAFEDPAHDRLAEQALTRVLQLGAPRKHLVEAALDLLNELYQRMGVDETPLQRARRLTRYDGPVFQDITGPAGLGQMKASRVAFGDYDSDGRPDLLLQGTHLFRNNGDLTFADVTAEAGIPPGTGAGGLWGDVNGDGHLDIVVISHQAGAEGDRVLLGSASGTFTPMPASMGSIDNGFPTEGAALFADHNGKTCLYLANYENWSEHSYYPDNVFRFDSDTVTEITQSAGFMDSGLSGTALEPQAGRGVAPADITGNGQSVLVTNYRLTRNFFFHPDPQKPGFYRDEAGHDGLAGTDNDGWYGHSIGADWGDWDNDGDLDLFIANLAHPRYIEFSDISALFRNDGMRTRIIDGQQIRYRHFENVTDSAGITYDELHSDPLWFDADNDGDLDLFITSIYVNGQSYLYQNNGDGTFTDITWLSGCRTYNGWGCAAADIDADGCPDLCVGSGSGTRLFWNRTLKGYNSMSYRPFRMGGRIHFVEDNNWNDTYPNSPAWGARVILATRNADGKTILRTRELRGGKGTTSQCAQSLHIGFGDETLQYVEFDDRLGEPVRVRY